MRQQTASTSSPRTGYFLTGTIPSAGHAYVAANRVIEAVADPGVNFWGRVQRQSQSKEPSRFLTRVTEGPLNLA